MPQKSIEKPAVPEEFGGPKSATACQDMLELQHFLTVAHDFEPPGR